MEFFEKRGIGIRGSSELFIDAFGVRKKNVLVSHAHSDHAGLTLSNNYFLTPETRALVGFEGKNCREVGFGEKFFVDDFEVSLHMSGHILGSAQFKIVNSTDVVVTADFKLQKSILLGGAEILPCDTLLIESTFGRPEFVFPKREEVYAEMIRWLNSEISRKRFVVLAGYSTGKAQELTKFSNEFLGEVPLVHKKVFEQNKVYEKFGENLGGYFALDNNLSDANILIVPPHFISDELLHALSHQLKRKVSCAIATGWKRHSRYKLFPLSDHADFPQLVQYVKESGAKRVFTYHGFDKELAQWVQKKLGVPAMPLRFAQQKSLAEFAG